MAPWCNRSGFDLRCRLLTESTPFHDRVRTKVEGPSGRELRSISRRSEQASDITAAPGSVSVRSAARSSPSGIGPWSSSIARICRRNPTDTGPGPHHEGVGKPGFGPDLGLRCAHHRQIDGCRLNTVRHRRRRRRGVPAHHVENEAAAVGDDQDRAAQRCRARPWRRTEFDFSNDGIKARNDEGVV
jgi:hypothetical protein